MILFSERQSLILHLLSEVHRPTTGAELAALLGVSPRTLRYDITRINGMSKATVVRATPSGYILDRSTYKAIVARNASLGTHLGHQERVLLYLLEHPMTDVYDIMRDCYLSESVTRAALRSLAHDLARHDLTLTCVGASVRLHGSEMNIRRLLGELIHNAMDVTVGRQERISRYLRGVELPRVEAAVSHVLGRAGQGLDDIHRSNLVVSLAICLQRHEFPVAPDDLPYASGTPAAQEIAQAVTSRLAHEYPGRVLTPNDRAYAESLVCLALSTTVERPSTRPNMVLDAIERCLDETARHFNLTVERDKLYPSISEHVIRTMARTATMPYFRNTLQESLRGRSPFLYDVAVYLAARLSQALGVAFLDDEIGLLAVYLGLYTTPPAAGHDEILVVVACPRYQSLRDWLLTELLEGYAGRMRIVDIVATPQDADRLRCDLVLNATDESDSTHPTVCISAVLSEIDRLAIDSALVTATAARSSSRTSRLVTKFLDPDLFFIGGEFPDSTAAISFLCDALEARGVVPPQFRESVLLRETYSPTAFGRRFAVPHAMDFLAHETKMAVCLPSVPVPWQVADASLIIMLAINGDDYDDFVEFYQPLVSLLFDSQLFTKLRRITDFESFKRFLIERIVPSTELD